MKNLKNWPGIIVSLIVPLSVPVISEAGELHQFAMHFSAGMRADECALVERYSAAQIETSSLQGQLSANGCEVIIPLQVYENRYQFCFLSGFNMYKMTDPEMIECAIQKRNDDYVFVVSGGGTGEGVRQVMCYFTCLGGDGT